MGSGLSKMYDDYDEYEFICKELNFNSVGMYKFYDHMDSILKERGFKNKYELFEFLRKQEERDKKIDGILGES